MNEPSDKRRYSLFSKPLKNCVEPLLRPVIREKGGAAAKLATHWHELVGSELAAYTMPIKVSFPKEKNRDGNLTIACEGPHALTLQHMQPVLLQRIASYFGYTAISRITIEQRTLKPAANKASAKKTSGKKTVIEASALQNIHDPELRDALSSLANSLSGDTL